jgi:hypothetical protein
MKDVNESERDVKEEEGGREWRSHIITHHNNQITYKYEAGCVSAGVGRKLEGV